MGIARGWETFFCSRSPFEMLKNVRGAPKTALNS